MPALQLTRPIVCFDLETTGVDPANDRIVEISVLRVEPDGTRSAKTRRINPEIPIPEGASAVHGIRDADVEGAPTFKQIARSLLDLLDGADLTGFNVSRFDIPLLEQEFKRNGFELQLADRHVVDALTIYHKMEPRDLSAATRFYLSRELEGAHGAEADVAASFEILEAQLERYADIPQTVKELDVWSRPDNAADRSGKFRLDAGRVVFNFGKFRGRPLDDVASEDRDYLEWILGGDFPDDSKAYVRDALDRQST